MRIRHVVPLLDSGAPDDLVVAQRVALASIEQARAFAGPGVEVAVMGAQFPDEPAPATAGVVPCPTLIRSARDVVPDGVRRRLPLLSEVLEALGDPDDFDIAIFTNADIAVQPVFYRAVAALVEAGVDAGSITRRTVGHPAAGYDLLLWGSIADGDPHPGHDCLFFPSSLLTGMDVGGVTLGASNVMRPLLAQLFVRSDHFRVLTDLHLTFHIDDSQDWQDDAYSPNAVYNSNEVIGVLGRMAMEYGTAAVAEFLRAEGFVPHPNATVPANLVELIAEGSPRKEPRPGLGARLNEATRPWPRVNTALNRASSLVRRGDSV